MDDLSGTEMPMLGVSFNLLILALEAKYCRVLCEDVSGKVISLGFYTLFRQYSRELPASQQ